MKNAELREIEALERLMTLHGADGEIVRAKVPVKDTLFATGLERGVPYFLEIRVKEKVEVAVMAAATRFLDTYDVFSRHGEIVQTPVLVDKHGSCFWLAQSSKEDRPISTVATMILENLDELVQDQRWTTLAKREYYPGVELRKFVAHIAYALSKNYSFDGVKSVYYRSEAPIFRLFRSRNGHAGPLKNLGRGDELREARVLLEDTFMSGLQDAVNGRTSAWVAWLMSFDMIDEIELLYVAKLLEQTSGYKIGPIPKVLSDVSFIPPLRKLELAVGDLINSMKLAGLLDEQIIADAANKVSEARSKGLLEWLATVTQFGTDVQRRLGQRFNDFCLEEGWNFHADVFEVVKERLKARIASTAAWTN